MKVLGIVVALCAAALLVNAYLATNRYDAAMKRCGEEHTYNTNHDVPDRPLVLKWCMDLAQEAHWYETWGWLTGTTYK
jgi:hypothetical protein